MLSLIGIVIIVLIVALLIYAATRPDTFRLQRVTSINTPPEKIVPFINDFHQWLVWSPWERLDSELKRSFSGASQGKGADTNGKATAKWVLEAWKSWRPLL